jgi:hypothetical protein
VIADPERRGSELAAFFALVAPRLFAEILESGILPDRVAAPDPAGARQEWECFALYACVRGLIAAGGFNRETATAIEALHENALGPLEDGAPPSSIAARRARIAERYAEYGAIGQAGGASGAATVTQRLGEAAARHIAGLDPPPPDLVELVGSLHESLAEGAAESVRAARPTG